MAKVALFTAYDNFALGIRLISSFLEKNGHQSYLFFLKKYSIKQIKFPREHPSNYEYTDIGKFFGTGYDVDPWTDVEIELLYKKLENYNPDIIGLSTRSFIEEKLLGILYQIKQRFPKSIIICGGFGPTFKPELYLQACDFVVRGEGEEAVLEIANSVDSGDLEKIKKIDNITYFKDGNLVRNPLRRVITDFKSIPFPKVGQKRIYHIDDNKIIERDDFRGVYNIFWGRGCLNKCSYCCAGQWSALYKSSGHSPRPYRRRSIDDVIAELRIAKELGFRNISFVDSYFGASYEMQKNLLQRYKKEIDLPFFAHFHPEMVISHPDLIGLACDCGLHSTVVGVQSGCETFARKVFNRKNKNKSLLEFARILSRHEGLNIQYHFIIGNPLETEHSFRETLDFIKMLSDDPDIRITTVGVHRLKLFPNTPLSEMVEKANVPSTTVKDWIYQSQISHLRLWLNERDFKRIYHNKEYQNDVNQLIKKCKRIAIPINLKLRWSKFLWRLKQGRYSEITAGTRNTYKKVIQHFIKFDDH